MIKICRKETTKLNNKIELISYSEFNPNKETVLFIAVTHGEEPQGERLILNFLDFLESQKSDIKKNLLFIPCLNPDGKKVKTRGNSRGVDINRNFPTKNWQKSKVKDEFYSGEAPSSEIETKFLMSVIDNYKPDIILTIHAPFKVVNFDGPAKEIAEEISKITGYPVQEGIGYLTPGSFGTYCGVERNIAVVTLELPDDEDDETLWATNEKVFHYLSGIS